jgi:hypothetical protein
LRITRPSTIRSFPSRIGRDLANHHGVVLPVPARSLACVALAALTGAACTLESGVGEDRGRTAVVADVPDRFRSSLDLLFVVDSTADAAALQSQLGSLFAEIFAYASLTDSGRLDLHVGVVSSDLGSGAAAVAGCTTAGDDGALRAPAPDAACAGLDDAWIDLRRDGNTIEGNVPGLGDPVELDAALQRAFGCMAQVGTSACSYPQPLAAARRALDADHPANQGFVRDDTALGVVFISGEDDCSAAGSSLFAGGDQGARFRCFDRGVTCEGDDVGGVMPGPQRGCRPAVGSDVLDVAAPAQTLRGLRSDDALVVTAALGDTAEIDVVDGPGGSPALAPACEGAEGALYPAVRLAGFVRQFAHSAVAPMCDGGPQALAKPTGAQLRRALGHRCLAERVRDLDADVPGIQWDCTVTAVGADGARTTLSACDSSAELTSTGPCFAIRAGTCPDFPSGLAVYVNWGGGRGHEAPLGVRTEVSCVVDD